MRWFAVVIIILFAFSFIPSTIACKDVIVMDGGTSGDYNLFMKVRDPSRPGLQILFMVDRGYTYTYHHPWKGYNIPYKVEHKLIGVATQGDVPPDIIKAGMLMSDANVVYGDADSPTFYVNPTRYAWDDFDWLRYAAQSANSVDEALEKLKEVEEMHAPGIGENLFVVGRDRAYVVEADAFHFVSNQVENIKAMSNYPCQLWHTRFLRKIVIASNFDRVYEGTVKRWQIVRIGGIEGVKFPKIGEGWVIARQVPGGSKVKIEEGSGSKVGNFYVEVERSDGKKADVKVCYEYYAWENKIRNILQEKYGKITVMDMMNLSRLKSEDLNGLRGMSEGEKKGTMIFKIPTGDGFTMAWFAPDACASIFVPVHICDKEITEEYKNGAAAELALSALTKFGEVNFHNVEKVLVKENERMEGIALRNREKAADILTLTDTEMQRQSFFMQKMYLNAGGEERSKILRIWNKDYYTTICNMEKIINGLDDNEKEMMAEMALSMGKIRAGVDEMVNGSHLMNDYSRAEELINKGKYREGIGVIKGIFRESDSNLFGISHAESKGNNDQFILISSFIIFVAIIAIMLKRPKKGG